ncbi:FadR/GntR family transcriptional regulator [Aidingimonas halophila]|uniref:Transcriptional regulator, GntR family n=1 Tax=Aidingimonas halophila TaxID=574349 RepID=A0A1H3E7P0_9GAMM|nr:FadR/GntR family transcriptional regulator [Aidingimonas halophila]GHC34020.1 GntR family transcriptional regulator [Aidingimonas halophila]SDX73944.1 transcriptional regulator, GntR family [Aidingimonas halophila]
MANHQQREELPGRAQSGGQTTKLSDRVYGDIIDRIIKREFEEGDRLPSEEALARSHGVSRPIVREALARLRKDGLVDSHRGAGSFVRRRPTRAMLDFAPLESLADIQRCFEFRIAVETESARLAALNATDEDRQAVGEALGLLEQRIRDNALGVDADFGFHLAIARATHNRYFSDTLLSLEQPITYGQNLARGLGLRRPLHHLPEVQEEHRHIADSILTGDSEAAARHMQAHLGNSRRRVFQG